MLSTQRVLIRLVPALVLALAFVLFLSATTHATTASFTAVQVTAPATLGTNNQSAATTTSTANTPETKATRTLTVSVAPLTATTITIGSCVVTFATTTGGVNSTQDLNCNDNTARITTATTSNDIAKTTTQIANDLLSLINASSTGTHGTLNVTASSTSATSVVFTTAGTESSATAITFTDGTAGKIITAAGALSNVTGVVPVAQVDTITISGAVDERDTYTLHLPSSHDATYTVAQSDLTVNDIATGLNAAVQASSGYSGQAFTSAASTNTVVLTAKTPGTGYTDATSSVTNRQAAAQSVTFTPANVDGSYLAGVTINGFETTAKVASVDDVLTGLSISPSGITCTHDTVAITCTANSTGVSFTYSSDILPRSSSGGGGGGGGGSSHSTPPAAGGTLASMIADIQAQIAALIAKSGGMAPSAGGSFSSDLHVGSTGAGVHSLQAWLNGHGFVVAASGPGSVGSETSTFGNATKAALAKFQAAHNISPAVGYLGPKTRALLNSLGL